MPNVTCPSCRQLVSIADAARNDVVTCPSCQREFLPADVAGFAAGLPKAGDGFEARPSRRSRDEAEDYADINIRARSSKWSATARGLSLIWWGTLVVLALSLVLGVVMTISPLDPENPPREVNPTLVSVMAGGCVMFVAFVVMFVGLCMCCTAPNPSARWRAIWTIINGVLGIGSGFVIGVVIGILVVQHAAKNNLPQQPVNPAVMRQEFGGLMIAASAVQGVFIAIAAACWLLFHAAVATHFQQPKLARFAYITLLAWLIVLPISFSLNNLPASTIGLEDIVKLRLQSIVSMVASAIAYSLYLVLCARTIAVIRDAMDAPQPDEA